MAKRKQKRDVGEGLTVDKAKEILAHGTLHGKPLSDKQKRFMEHTVKGNVHLSRPKP